MEFEMLIHRVSRKKRWLRSSGQCTHKGKAAEDSGTGDVWDWAATATGRHDPGVSKGNLPKSDFPSFVVVSLGIWRCGNASTLKVSRG